MEEGKEVRFRAGIASRKMERKQRISERSDKG